MILQENLAGADVFIDLSRFDKHSINILQGVRV